VLGDAAQQQVVDHAFTVLADDDEIAVALLLLLDDEARCIAVQHESGDGS
jgi:hypothetical protein